LNASASAAAGAKAPCDLVQRRAVRREHVAEAARRGLAVAARSRLPHVRVALRGGELRGVHQQRLAHERHARRHGHEPPRCGAAADARLGPNARKRKLVCSAGVLLMRSELDGPPV
jgi:hypothetical protein